MRIDIKQATSYYSRIRSTLLDLQYYFQNYIVNSYFASELSKIFFYRHAVHMLHATDGTKDPRSRVV
jgi:hypothetical protein